MTEAERKERVVSREARIANFERLENQSDPRYIAFIEELDTLRSGGLEIRKTVEVIRDSARGRNFLAYKNIAEENRLSWVKARRPIFRHLDEVCKYAHFRGWPLITSIVVDDKSKNTGALNANALDGFVKTARRLDGFVGVDEERFLQRQQEATFAWAQEAKIA